MTEREPTPLEELRYCMYWDSISDVKESVMRCY